MPASPLKAVAFDLDGLIFNTEHVFVLAAEMIVARRDLPMPPDLIQRMMGRRPPEGFRIMRELLGIEDSSEALFAETRSTFLELLDQHLEPMPGAFEVFDLLESIPLPKAVATSSPREFLDNLLGRFNLHSRFEFALTAEDVVNGKPHPEIYLKAADRFGIAPGEMLVFEDSENGTRAAVAAGAFVVSVPHEHSRNQDFQSASRVANTLRDPLIRDLLPLK